MAVDSSRSAVITGAGRGIGRALAMTLARLGYGVALQARSPDQLESVKNEIEAAGGRAIVVPGDVTARSAARALVARATEALGPLAVAVPCAGQARSTPLAKIDEDDFRALLDVNTVGVFHLVQAAGLKMAQQGHGGRIVVIASTASVKAFRYTAAYTAAKHAALGLVKTAALELARDRITVNAICPGWVDTDLLDGALENIAEKTGGTKEEARRRIERMIPMGAILTPDEVAGMLAYLVSPAARHLTGQALVLDGGETI